MKIFFWDICVPDTSQGSCFGHQFKLLPISSLAPILWIQMWYTSSAALHCTSLVHRLFPHMTTMNSKERESLVTFQTWCNGTNVMDISIGKFRRHSLADCPFSYSLYLRVWSLGPLKRKGRPGYAVDGARQFAGTNFCHRRVRNE